MRLKDILSERIIEIISIIMLLIICMKNILDYNMIHVCGDEFGYWANAAYWRGVDWHSLMENTPYYSYGYSILLFLITMLPFNMSLIYQIAIALNVIMLIAIYRLCAYVIRLWFPEIKNKESDFIALIITLYPSLLTYTQSTYCETFIVLLYWLVLVSIIKFESTEKICYGILSILLSISMYVVHQRNLGILCVSILIVGCIIFRRRGKIHKFLLLIGIIVPLLGISVWIKNNFSSLQWISHGYAVVNNYSNVGSKIESIFELEGIKKFLISIVGKLFYMASASYLLVYVGMILGGTIIIHVITGKIYKEKIYGFVWVILSFVFSVGIASVALIDNERMDCMIYGRYSESAAGALILLGIIAIYQKKVSKKQLFIITAIYCSSVFLLLGLAGKFQGTELVSLTITGVYRTMHGSTYYAGALCKVVLMTNLMAILLYYFGMQKKNKKIGFYIALSFTGGMWMLNADYVIKNTLLFNQQMYTEKILPIAQRIEEDENVEKVIYVIEDRNISQKDYRDTNIDRLQYLLWDIPIERVEMSELDIKIYEDGTYFVLIKYADIYDRFKDTYNLDIVSETAMMVLFRY